MKVLTKHGDFGPYRQSERKDLVYAAYALEHPSRKRGMLITHLIRLNRSHFHRLRIMSLKEKHLSTMPTIG